MLLYLPFAPKCHGGVLGHLDLIFAHMHPGTHAYT